MFWFPIEKEITILLKVDLGFELEIILIIEMNCYFVWKTMTSAQENLTCVVLFHAAFLK